MACLEKLCAGAGTATHHEELAGELQSPEKYKAVVQCLVQYTTVLTDIARQQQQREEEEEEEDEESGGGRQEQEQERALSLQALCGMENELARYFPPPLSSPADAHADADFDSSTSQLLFLTMDAKHSSLLSTLSDLKQHVLWREGRVGVESTPLEVAALSLCSVSLGREGGGSAGADAGDERYGTSATNEEADDAIDDEEEGDGRGGVLGGDAGGSAGGKVKRLNKSCTSVLTMWLLDHLDYPFPSPQEKADLGAMLRLKPGQGGNWMTNMRKRHVYPVLEGKRRPKSAVELAIVERHRQQGHRELYSTSVATSNADADPDADAIIDTPADTSMTASDWSRAEEDTVWDTASAAGAGKGKHGQGTLLRNYQHISLAKSPIFLDDRSSRNTTTNSSISDNESDGDSKGTRHLLVARAGHGHGICGGMEIGAATSGSEKRCRVWQECVDECVNGGERSTLAVSGTMGSQGQDQGPHKTCKRTKSSDEHTQQQQQQQQAAWQSWQQSLSGQEREVGCDLEQGQGLGLGWRAQHPHDDGVQSWGRSSRNLALLAAEEDDAFRQLCATWVVTGTKSEDSNDSKLEDHHTV